MAQNVRGNKFLFTLKNTTGGDLIVALLAAFFDTKDNVTPFMQNSPTNIVSAGYACDIVADDGIIIDGQTPGADLVLTSINAKKKYRAFREYIKQYGATLQSMSIQTNNLAAFNQTLNIIDCSPLEADKPIDIPLVALRDGASNLNDIVALDGDGIVLGADTLMLLPVLNGHELTVTFWF